MWMLEGDSMCFLQWPRVDKQTLIWTLVTIIISSSAISSSTKKHLEKQEEPIQRRLDQSVGQSTWDLVRDAAKVIVSNSLCTNPDVAHRPQQEHEGRSDRSELPVWRRFPLQRPQWGGASRGSTQKIWDHLVHEGLKSSWIFFFFLVMHSFFRLRCEQSCSTVLITPFSATFTWGKWSQ